MPQTSTATSQTGRRRLRLGIMGGTFDPIHHGHLVAASEVASEFALDEVIFVPTGQPWQKVGGEVTTAEHRYLLTVIATASNPRFSVSRVDIDRGGPTYTIDTLRDFRRMYPQADLFFITGADAMAQIMSWKNVEELWGLAHFVSVTRPGFVSEDFGRSHQISLVEIPAMAISSTDCRDRVHRYKPVWYLVPDGVVQYIAKHRLYQHSSSTREADAPAEQSSGHNMVDSGGEDTHGAQPARPPEAGRKEARR